MINKKKYREKRTYNTDIEQRIGNKEGHDVTIPYVTISENINLNIVKLQLLGCK